jgi:hypothetical protein
MAYAHSATAPQALVFQPARAPSPSLFSRLLRYIAEASQRRAEREIARFLANNGGKFTDATEREIEQRFLSDLMR